MYKALVPYLILIFFAGCSVTGRHGKSVLGNSENEKQLKFNYNGLTQSSFFIQRADIEVLTNNEKNSFIASVKFNRPDSFLISIRSKTGIEVARVFLTKDSVLVNDRLNKVLYYGAEEALRKKYGYGNELIYLISGGFIEDLKSKNEIFNCNNGKIYYTSNVCGRNVDYLIECKALEINTITVESTDSGKDLRINYFGKEKKEGFVFFRNIELRNINEYELVKIEIKKLVIPYEGEIEFIPGKNFEQVEIK